MEFDFTRLRSRIRAKGYSIRSFATKVGIDGTTLCKKLKNEREFTISEIFKIKELLEIKEIEKYFFCPVCLKN